MDQQNKRKKRLVSWVKIREDFYILLLIFPPFRFTNAASLSAHKADHDRDLFSTPPDAKTKKATPAVKVVKSSPSKAAAGAAASEGGGEVKATCPECHKTFRRQFNLKIHVDRVSG